MHIYWPAVQTPCGHYTLICFISDPGPGELNTGQKVGIVIGCVFGLLAIIVAGLYVERYCRRKRHVNALLHNDLQDSVGQSYDNPVSDSNFFALREREMERERERERDNLKSNLTLTRQY